MEKTPAAMPRTPGDFRSLFAFNPLKGLGEGSGDVHAEDAAVQRRHLALFGLPQWQEAEGQSDPARSGERTLGHHAPPR